VPAPAELKFRPTIPGDLANRPYELSSIMHLLLASASPRRAELLAAAGFVFDIEPTSVDETPHPDEAPRDYALRVALDKARAAAATCRKSGTVVIAADTVVVAGGQVLGKPDDDADARRMLKRLSGDVHSVFTAVVLHRDGRQVTDVIESRVHLLPLSDGEIDWYIRSGEPEGKAGAYAIQGRAARFIDWMEGSWSNVVGLPVATVHRLLKELGEVVS
jgi:septum formation protein